MKHFDPRDELHLVTGASSGIGWATTIAMLNAGSSMVVAGRNVKRMNQLFDAITRPREIRLQVMELDLASPASIISFVDELASQGTGVSTLINNAGISLTRECRLDDGMERTWGVNVRGPYMLTTALATAGVLRAGSQVLNVTSKYHADLLSKDHCRGSASFRIGESYMQSKLSLILLTYAMAPGLRQDFGICVNAIDPGVVRSNLGHDSWFSRSIGRSVGLFLPPASSAATSILRTMDITRAEGLTGKYFEDGQVKAPRYKGDVVTDSDWLLAILRDQSLLARKAAKDSDTGMGGG